MVRNLRKRGFDVWIHCCCRALPGDDGTPAVIRRLYIDHEAPRLLSSGDIAIQISAGLRCDSKKLKALQKSHRVPKPRPASLFRTSEARSIRRTSSSAAPK